MEKEIYIHAGMPKCGSTYLQEEVFPQLNELYFTHLQMYNTCPIAMFLKRAVYANPLLYNIKEEATESYEYLVKLEKKKVLISWEGLYGDCFNNSMNTLFLNKLLKYNYPNAKILLIIRRQCDLIESLYKQCLHQYHSMKVDEFLNYQSDTGRFLPFKPAWWIGMNVDVRAFNFYEIAQAYIKLFGNKNVKIIPYELMIDNKNFFLEEIASFLKVNAYFPENNVYINRSFSKYTSNAARLINKFISVEHNPIKIIKKGSILDPMNGLKRIDKIFYKKKYFINEDKRHKIMEINMKSNIKLNDLVDYDLKKFKYF
tara:strand:+ start:5344 stop:6285 length:942 start_codon:yes stop_codon:yes gene_type:complete